MAHTTGMLATVYQRGLGAFNTCHSPNVKSACQWAFARRNAFLYAIKVGRLAKSKIYNRLRFITKETPEV